MSKKPNKKPSPAPAPAPPTEGPEKPALTGGGSVMDSIPQIQHKASHTGLQFLAFCTRYGILVMYALDALQTWGATMAFSKAMGLQPVPYRHLPTPTTLPSECTYPRDWVQEHLSLHLQDIASWIDPGTKVDSFTLKDLVDGVEGSFDGLVDVYDRGYAVLMEEAGKVLGTFADDPPPRVLSAAYVRSTLREWMPSPSLEANAFHEFLFPLLHMAFVREVQTRGELRRFSVTHLFTLGDNP